MGSGIRMSFRTTTSTPKETSAVEFSRRRAKRRATSFGVQGLVVLVGKRKGRNTISEGALRRPSSKIFVAKLADISGSHARS